MWKWECNVKWRTSIQYVSNYILEFWNSELFLGWHADSLFCLFTCNWVFHKCKRLAILSLLRLSILFTPIDASKCEIRSQFVQEDYIPRLQTSSAESIPKGIAKTKLAILAFMYCGEFVKNCNVDSRVICKRKNLLEFFPLTAEIDTTAFTNYIIWTSDLLY